MRAHTKARISAGGAARCCPRRLKGGGGAEAVDKPGRGRYNGRKGGLTMPKIDAAIGIRVTKDLKARLEQQARSEMKSVSALIVQVMEDYLEANGNGKAR